MCLVHYGRVSASTAIKFILYTLCIAQVSLTDYLTQNAGVRSIHTLKYSECLHHLRFYCLCFVDYKFVLVINSVIVLLFRIFTLQNSVSVYHI